MLRPLLGKNSPQRKCINVRFNTILSSSSCMYKTVCICGLTGCFSKLNGSIRIADMLIPGSHHHHRKESLSFSTYSISQQMSLFTSQGQN